MFKNNKYPFINKTDKFKLSFALITLYFLFNSILISKNDSNFENDHVLDSLLSLLKNEINDTSKINLLNNISWHLAPTNMDKSILYADSAFRISENINWKLGKALAFNNKGESLRNKGLFEESLKQHESALKIFQDLDDQEGIAKTESNIGISYFNLSDFSKSFNHFDQALDIYKAKNDQVGICNVNSYIGVVFSNFGQNEKAIEYFEKSLVIAREIKNKPKIAIQLNNIALAYVDLKRYSLAIKYYKKAIQLFKESNDEFNFSIALGNLGIPYTELKEYQEAAKSFNKSLELANKLNDDYGKAHQYGNLGELYFKMAMDNNSNLTQKNDKDYINKSINYLKLSIDQFGALAAIEDQKDYLKLLSDAFAYSGNYKNSLKSLKEANQLQDSIQAKENLKITASLEIKQELENKEKEIIILNQDKEYEAIVKTSIIIFTLLIMFIAGLILFFYRKKRKDNILLQKNIQIRQETEKSLRLNEAELTKHKNNLEILVKDRTKKLEHEILEHKETEEALLLAIERAEIANNAKSVFLANMSHELRTPLVGILGYSELLTTIIKEKDVRDMAEGINRTGNRLLNTLSLVLDLARIESDKFEIDISNIDILHEIRETYKNFKALAEKKNLNLILDLHADSFFYNTDVGMFKVILDNLVNNAIKFTNVGQITISSKIESRDNIPYLLIKVIDTGLGIKQKDIPLIFDEFKQLSEGFNKDFQGSGLGLSITKKFVNLLGGNILVDSSPGEGSTFTISFPVEIKAVA